MLNIRKRFFLLLTIIGLMFVVASCTTSTDYVKVTFDSNTYEVKVGQTLEIEPLISKGSSVGAVSLEYSSYDDSIATYENGKLTGVQPGEVVIKVVCTEKPVAYDTATVYVVADDLPQVNFSELPETIYKGESVTLTYSFTPEYAEATVEFSSANPEVAVVDENGVITGTGMGTAVISARVTDVYGQYRDYNFSIVVEPADYEIKYELDGGTNNPENPTFYNTLTLPTTLLAPTKEGYKFLGWYSGDEKVETIEQGTEGEVSVTAKWELVTYTISYNLNGGNLANVPWQTRAELVADLVADFNKVKGTNYTVDTFVNHTSTGYNYFAGTNGSKTFFADADMRAKWGWLLEYAKSLRQEAGLKVDQYDGLLANGYITAEAATVNVELVAFIGAKQYAASGYASSDYSIASNNDGFWDLILGFVKEYTILSEDVVLPTDLVKTGYNFLGWYLNGEKVEKIATGSTGNVKLEAQWEIIEYTVELDYNGMPSNEYLYSSREEMIADFVADFKAITGVELKTSVSANGVAGTNANQKTFWDNDEMFAKWGWLAQYLLDTATAHGNNGIHSEQKAQYEDILNRVDRSAEGSYSWWALRRDVYGFVAGFYNGWYTSNGKVDWSKEELNNGFWDYVKDPNYVAPQTTFKYTVETGLELPVPAYGDWEFLGWYNGEQKVETIEKGTIGDYKLVAKWYNPNAVYDINYELAEGKLPEGATTSFVAKDGLAELPVPTKLGYTFKGWYADAECTQAVTSIEAGVALAGVTLYAAWELETYNIEYELNGGEFQTDQVVPLYDSFEALVTDFINDYSTFTGLTGVTAANFYGKSSQLGVYGFFKNEAMAQKWTWLLDFVNAQAVATNYAGKTYLNVNAGVANFNKYMRSNLGGFLQETKLTTISPVSMDFTNVDGEALWAACPTQEIKVGIEAKNSYTILDLPLELATPFKEGATFVGWYLNENLKDGKVETITEELVGNVKLYARWSDSQIAFENYSIEYVLSGGELPQGAPTSYVEEQGVKLVDATRLGYVFKGWYLDAECTQAVTEFTASDKGNKTVYASWEAIEYSVSFEVGDGKLPTVSVPEGDYVDRAAVLADLVADFNKVKGTNYTIDTFVNHTSSGYNFFAGSETAKTFFADADMRAKWGWLITYAKLNREAAGLDVKQYDGLLKDGYVAADAATVNVELVAFIKGQQYSYKVSDTLTYSSSDYSQTEVQEKVWEYVEKVHYVEVVADVKFTVADLPYQLPEPTPAAGKVFYGWYLDAEFTGEPLFAIPANTAQNLKLYAKYVEENTEIKYEINYELNGGTLSEGAATEYVGGTALPLNATATKLGYTFTGWYLDAELTQAVTEISADQKGNVTLYAKFQANPKHTITYVLSDGTLLEGAPTEYTEGVGAALVEATKANHKFGGWFLNPEFTGEAVTSVSVDAKEDLTLYALWIAYEQKTITWVVNEGNLPTDAPKVYYVGLGLEFNVVPTKEGYNFLGWYDNPECEGEAVTSISTEATEDITLYALWQDLSKVYSVTYNLNGGNTLYQNREEVVAEFLKDISAISDTEITASNFKSKGRQAQFTALLADDALWAKWEWLFKFIASENKNDNAPAFYEEVLTKRTCTSANWWFLTRDFAGFVNKAVGDFYYATAPIDFRTYASGDGFWGEIQSQYVDTKALSLVTPYRPYYTFEGWYTNAEFTGEPVTSLSSDCTLYAKWTKQTVKLTYVLNNENASLASTVVELHASDSVAQLPTPTFDAAAYVFNGWFTDAECTNKVLEVGEYQLADVTLYASWTENDGYDLTYVLNGGNWTYSSREQLVDDFLTDIMAFYEKTSKPDGMVQGVGETTIGYANVFTATYSFFTSNKYSEKWTWLKDYLLEASKDANGGDTYTNLQKGTAGDAFWRYTVGAFLFQEQRTAWPISADFTSNELANGFWEELSDGQQSEFKNNKGTVTLPTPIRLYYTFAGWYTNPEFTGEAVTTVSSATTLYAKWVEEIPVESITITNKVEELKRFGTHQLTWALNPENAAIKNVQFTSSDTSVATVDENGLITAVGIGTVTIKVTSLSPSGKSDEFSFNVYDPDHFEASYATESYVAVGGQIKLLAEFVKRDGSTVSVDWANINSDIAIVDSDGIVTGVNPGIATIRAILSTNSETYFDFVVTVLDPNMSAALKHVVDAHESNVFVKYNLGIGSGTPKYYADIFGSVSKMLYNKPLYIDKSFLEAGNAADKYNTDELKNGQIHFITVHYTGNMGNGSDVDNNAAYFTSGQYDVSIHYVTGNDGDGSAGGTAGSSVYQTLSHDHGAWHAGDSSAKSVAGAFKWNPTGVAYDGTPLLEVKFSASDDFYFEINGKKTSVKLPATRNYESRNTDHIYNADGTITSQSDYTGTKFSNRTPESFFNDQGFPITVIDDQYYMGTTWWSYHQVHEGRICGSGGNRNSIGIESCVDEGSDLWYTWQITAQLVAKLMYENDLDISRVKGHHFFDGKDCPQPMLENDLEIWWEFIDLVQAEYELLTTFSDAKYSFEVDEEFDFVNNYGRVTEQPEYTQIVTYTVTVEVNGFLETIVLGSAVEGIYSK